MANIIQAFPRGSGNGSGGGAIFSYVDGTKTALNDDWLKDVDNNTIEPEEGLLYLVLSSGEFYNSIYRFNDATSKYVLVYRPPQFTTMPNPTANYLGAVVQYTGMTTVNYTHDHFYECVESSGNYAWVKCRVEDQETVEITVQEFEQLPTSQKNNGQVYFITDGDSSANYLARVGFTPVGSIILASGTTAQNHYLKCDGSVYSISLYPDLANHFESQFGSKNYFGGDGTTTFAVPNYSSSLTGAVYCIATKNIFIDVKDQSSFIEASVGFWEDGSTKYQITITGTTILGTSGTISTGLSGISYAEIIRFQVSNGTYVKNLINDVSIKQDGSEIGMVANADSTFTNKTFYATIQYKKSSS